MELFTSRLNRIEENLSDAEGNIINVQNSLPFKLAIDPETGDYGYIKNGENTITPFIFKHDDGINKDVGEFLIKSFYTEDEFTEYALTKYSKYIFENTTLINSMIGKKVRINNIEMNKNGTTKDIGYAEFTIIDYNHEGSTNTFDLYADNCTNDGQAWHTNARGYRSNQLWKNSELRTYMNYNLYHGFIGSIKPYILNRNVMTYDSINKSYYITQDYCTPLSITELGAAAISTYQEAHGKKYGIDIGEGEKYNYFDLGIKVKAKRSNNITSTFSRTCSNTGAYTDWAMICIIWYNANYDTNYFNENQANSVPGGIPLIRVQADLSKAEI